MDPRDVVVTGFRLNASEQPAKVLQRLLGLDETHARALAKRFPCVVRANEPWTEAERLMLSLRDAGAYAHLREPGARTEPPAPMEAASPNAPAAAVVDRAKAETAPTAEPTKTQPAVVDATKAQTAAVSPSAQQANQAASTAAPTSAQPALAAAPSSPALEVKSPYSKLAPLPEEDFAGAPTLFANAVEPPARVSRYELGELEIVPSKSQPAPPMTASRSEPAPPIKSQPAPAIKSQPAPPIKSQPAPPIKSQPAPPIKSQPAPAIKSQPAPAIKSQPAPAIKSQPAPAPAGDPGLEAAGLRMLGDSLDDDGDDGRTFDLDERALGPQTNRVQTTRGTKIEKKEPRKRRGFFATLLFPLVLAQAAVPHALALTGVAAASGAAVYIVRTSGRSEASAQEKDGGDVSLEAGKRIDAKKEGIMGMLEDLISDKEAESQAQIGPAANKDKIIDESGKAADPGAEKLSAAPATHPLIKLAPKAMEGSMASILRGRIRGVHKVAVKWEDGEKPEGHVECMLLEEAEAQNLKELASTGTMVAIPPSVRDQLQDHILVLRTANADQTAGYLPICLAN